MNPFRTVLAVCLSLVLLTGGFAEEAHGAGAEAAAAVEHSITHQMMLLMLQLGVIIVVARTAGEVFERLLKQPAVLGELLSGVLIGPYALGAMELPYLGALFPHPGSGMSIPVSEALYGVSTMASVILLFLVGLETDFEKFLRYSFPGLLVGIGGVLGAFVLGDWLTASWKNGWTLAVPLHTSDGYGLLDPVPLFMGVVSLATSVGITARVLSDRHCLDTPEGTTILAGAVIDDVLGILALGLVTALATAARVGTGGGEAAPAEGPNLGVLALKAAGFFLLFGGGGLLLSRPLGRLFRRFRSTGITVPVGLAIAFVVAGCAELFGLALIVGAYLIGLVLSREDYSHDLERGLSMVYQCLVPVFFVVMGMLVDVRELANVSLLGFGLIFSVVAILGKVLGCGLPTRLVGFNMRGALRVGLGMVPRGEVALIVTGVGVAYGFLPPDLVTVSIMMTLITTVAAPPALVLAFRNPASGLRPRPGEKEGAGRQMRTFHVSGILTHAGGQFIERVLTEEFERAGYVHTLLDPDGGIHVYRAGAEDGVTSVEMLVRDGVMELVTSAEHEARARGVLQRALARVQETVEGYRIQEGASPERSSG